MTNEDDDERSTLSVEVGRRLRAIRNARGQSLHDVQRSSGGRWRASAIGAYERGFRNVSLPRLRALAEFYAVPLAVLLGEAKPAEHALSGSPKVVLDLEAVGQVVGAEPIMGYLRRIIVERGDFNGRVLSIRAHDIRALCAILQVTETELFVTLDRWGVLVRGTGERA